MNSVGLSDEEFRKLMVPVKVPVATSQAKQKPPGKSGRPRVYGNTADRQRAYRQRKKQGAAT